jgi:hypothetical protein
VLMSVKPSTDSVTSSPIDQLMLFMVVENTIGRHVWQMLLDQDLPRAHAGEDAGLGELTMRRLSATERIRRAS